MNRRSFLKWLGTGLAVGAVASQLPIEEVLAFNPHRVYFDMGTIKSLGYQYTYTYQNSLTGEITDPSLPTVEMVREAVKLLKGAAVRPFNGEFYTFPVHLDRYAEYCALVS